MNGRLRRRLNWAVGARTWRTACSASPDLGVGRPGSSVARLLRRRQDLVHARKEFYGRTSTPAALWSPWAVRPALWVAWTPRGRARCAGSSPWTSAPSLPPLLAHRQPAKTKGDEEVPPELADGRARGPAAYLWLVVSLPREYRPRQPPTAAPLSNARLAARSAENRVIMTARCRMSPKSDAPRIAGPGPFGIPVRLCTAIPEGPDRLQWRPVFTTSQTCGSQAQGPSGVLVRLCTATPRDFHPSYTRKERESTADGGA